MSCASSVATRGIMYSNYPRPVATGNRWHPLHKPQWLEVNRSYHDNCAAARDIFLHLNISLHGKLHYILCNEKLAQQKMFMHFTFCWSTNFF